MRAAVGIARVHQRQFVFVPTEFGVVHRGTRAIEFIVITSAGTSTGSTTSARSILAAQRSGVQAAVSRLFEQVLDAFDIQPREQQRRGVGRRWRSFPLSPASKRRRGLRVARW